MSAGNESWWVIQFSKGLLPVHVVYESSVKMYHYLTPILFIFYVYVCLYIVCRCAGCVVVCVRVLWCVCVCVCSLKSFSIYFLSRCLSFSLSILCVVCVWVLRMCVLCEWCCTCIYSLNFLSVHLFFYFSLSLSLSFLVLLCVRRTPLLSGMQNDFSTVEAMH